MPLIWLLMGFPLKPRPKRCPPSPFKRIHSNGFPPLDSTFLMVLVDGVSSNALLEAPSKVKYLHSNRLQPLARDWI